MKTKILVAIIALLFTIQAQSQNYDFGKVSKEELQEKFHSNDSSAVAAVLYKKEEIKFHFTNTEGFRQERIVHERIKIYNKDGFDWATQKVYLYKGTSNSNEKISNLKAYTYNLVDGKIEKEKLSKDGKFTEDRSEHIRVSSFTMPNVKEGCVIEFKYTVSTARKSIEDVVLQYDIPINKVDIKIATPEYYIYNALLNPRASFTPKLVTSQKTTQVPFEYMMNIISINEHHVPGLKSEAFAGNIDNYRCKLSLELTAALNAQKILDKTFTTTWEKVSRTIYESQYFGQQIEKTNFYKDELQAQVANATDDFEKAQTVEAFVKSKVKWNGNYGKYSQNGIRTAYKEGEGNAADINLLVVSMLRSLGVNAHPVLISTRNNGIPLFPTLNGFNYVICSVQKGEEFLLIDATSQYSAGNILPFRVLNWQGRLIENSSVSRWVNIMPNKKSVESTMLNVKINDDFTASGKVSKNLTSYVAYSYRTNNSDISEEEHLKKLETDKGDIEISNLNFENSKDISKPAKLNYEYELSDAIDEIGDKLYFAPMLFFKTDENPFKLEKRDYPIDFVIPYSDKYYVNIMLPKGYKVESLPKKSILEFKDADAKFSYMISSNGQYLQLKVQLDINNPFILPVDYESFKDFYSRIVEKQSEQIVLAKLEG
ncbi:DUF3857 domain-containing protein [Winogradskyella sp.]|uniref:DUF3857 domain-containing protein n=1 Tax=Winogradskyella sp. TaxID=1883156 RepID=UPI002603FF15|nr:DUF3857 domain-containing protein [Winogradskyella sp.]